MLYAVSTTYRDLSEESQARLWTVFSQWKPTVEMKSAYVRSDGMGSLLMIETDSAEALLEASIVHRPYLDIVSTPVVPIEEAMPIITRALAWRDGVR